MFCCNFICLLLLILAGFSSRISGQPDIRQTKQDIRPDTGYQKRPDRYPVQPYSLSYVGWTPTKEKAMDKTPMLRTCIPSTGELTVGPAGMVDTSHPKFNYLQGGFGL